MTSLTASEYSPIKAIKLVRERTNLGLKEAKDLVFEIIPMLQSDEVIADMRTRLEYMQTEKTQAQADLFEVIRMVDYFVAHPAEWENWKAGEVSTEPE